MDSKALMIAGAEEGEPEWAPDFKSAVFFLAGNYAAEWVRKNQEWAASRGSKLEAKEIASLFREACESMTLKILNGAGVGPIIDCPDCSRGLRVKDGYWVKCSTCGGTAKIPRPKPSPTTP